MESPEGNRAQITCAWTAWRIEATCHLEHVTDLTLCWRCCSSKGVSTQLDATFHASVLQIVFLASCTSSVRRNQCHSLMPCALVLSCASSFLLRTIAALQLLLRGWLLLHWLCSVRQHQIHLYMLINYKDLIKLVHHHLWMYVLALFFCLYVVAFLLEIPRQPSVARNSKASKSIEEHHFVSSGRDHAHRWQSDRTINWAIESFHWLGLHLSPQFEILWLNELSTPLHEIHEPVLLLTLASHRLHVELKLPSEQLNKFWAMHAEFCRNGTCGCGGTARPLNTQQISSTKDPAAVGTTYWHTATTLFSCFASTSQLLHISRSSELAWWSQHNPHRSIGANIPTIFWSMICHLLTCNIHHFKSHQNILSTSKYINFSKPRSILGHGVNRRLKTSESATMNRQLQRQYRQLKQRDW